MKQTISSDTIISVDIGGTFTDIIVLNKDHIVKVLKVMTTPANPEDGVLQGLRKSGLEKFSEFVHATTIGTNSLLGQYGLTVPKVCLFTTKGFRDIIEIGRQNRPSLYDFNFHRPRVLVERNMRYDIDERTDVNGTIIQDVNMDDIETLAKKAKKIGAKSIAISFLHSYINDTNERKTANYLKKYFDFVSASSEVAPEPREFERTSTTVINAALIPVFSNYINKLDQNLGEFGSPPISVMSNSGGLISKEETIRKPVSVIESGPAAGVIAANEFAKTIGIKNVISLDMGGTTAKAGSVINNKVDITSEYEVGGSSHHGRSVKGSGYPVRYPFVDLAEVSAGGGTIIWKDSSGGINVGPISAGADPGPICYARGGKDPTITDANLILGIIGEKMSGSDFLLNKDLALRSLEKIGDPYEISRTAIELINMEMARAVRIVTTERGLDPADFTLFAFGGSGPQHACSVASELKINTVIIPPKPGVFSALGLLYSDWKYELRQSYPDNIQGSFDKMKKQLKDRFEVEEFEIFADCRYMGQGSEITVPVKKESYDLIKQDFERIHRETFGFNLNRDVEIVTARTFGIKHRKKPDITGESGESIEDHVKTMRNAMVGDRMLNVPVYSRNSLIEGTKIDGPILIDEMGSTTVIPEGWIMCVGKNMELRLEVI